MVDEKPATADHLRALVVHLVAVKATLRGEDVEPGDSLTEDLGFDSMDLVALASRVRGEYPDFDLRQWLANAVQSDVDSVGSMAVLLADANGLPEASGVR